MAQSFLGATFKAIPKRDDFAMWVFCNWRQISHYSALLNGMGLLSQACIVWDKQSSGLGAGGYNNRHELILFGYRGSPMNNEFIPDVIECKRVTPTRKQHVFDKPVMLLERMLLPFAGEGRRMSDPFCGAGSALVAGQRLGWDVTGIDISKKYCETATSRLAQRTLA